MAPVMTSHRGVGSRAPLTGLIAAVLALILLPALALGADWQKARRVTEFGGARLDSLHQLAADRGTLHLVHPRIGSGATDVRIADRFLGQQTLAPRHGCCRLRQLDHHGRHVRSSTVLNDGSRFSLIGRSTRPPVSWRLFRA